MTDNTAANQLSDAISARFDVVDKPAQQQELLFEESSSEPQA